MSKKKKIIFHCTKIFIYKQLKFYLKSQVKSRKKMKGSFPVFFFRGQVFQRVAINGHKMIFYDSNLFLKISYVMPRSEREKVFVYELLQKTGWHCTLEEIIYECLLQWFSNTKKDNLCASRCDDEVKNKYLRKEIFLIDKFMIYELDFFGVLS